MARRYQAWWTRDVGGWFCACADIVRTNGPHPPGQEPPGMARRYQSPAGPSDAKKNAPRMRGALSTTYVGDQPW